MNVASLCHISPLLLLLLFNIVASSSTFYGKLVLKISVASKKNLVFSHRPTVFATRRSTYLKKDGDVFKIHIPGIARNSTADSISFESVRFPGYYLRHKQVNNDYRFRIAKPLSQDNHFNEEATFLIQRHSGIEGSGMLKLFDDPSYYLCVRKYNYADSALKAMKNDNTEDFRARCSFFIQKLKPENVDDAVKKSTQSDNKNNVNKQTNTLQLKKQVMGKQANISSLDNLPVSIVINNNENSNKKVVSNQDKANNKATTSKQNKNPLVNKQVLANQGNNKPIVNKPIVTNQDKTKETVNDKHATNKKQVANNKPADNHKLVASQKQQVGKTKGYVPKEDVVRKMLDAYVKKIETDSKDFFQKQLSDIKEVPNEKHVQLTAHNNAIENPTAKTWIGNENADYNSKQNGGVNSYYAGQRVDNMRQNTNNYYPTVNPYENMVNMYSQNSLLQNNYPPQNYMNPQTNMLSYFPIVSRYDPTKQNIRSFFQPTNEKLANQETNHAVEVGTAEASWKQDVRHDIKSNVKVPPPVSMQPHAGKYQKNLPIHEAYNNPKSFKATPISASNKPKSQSNAHSNNTHQILKDIKQSKQRHQEPSLNLDGSTKNATISSTRSKVKGSHRISYAHSNTTHQILKDTLHNKQRHQEPALNIDGSTKNATLTLMRSNVNSPQKSGPLNKKQNTMPKNLVKDLGPAKPINLAKFGKHHHREPSLNLDGLMQTVKVPGTRSNISNIHSNTTKINPVATALSKSSATNLTAVSKDVYKTDAHVLFSKSNELLGVTRLNDHAIENPGKKGDIAGTDSKLVNSTEKEKNVLGKPSTAKDTQSNKSLTPMAVTAAKKENLIDETLKNFTTDSDIDFKIFGDDKYNETAISDESSPYEEDKKTPDTPNNTSSVALSDIKSNSSMDADKIFKAAMADDPTLKNSTVTQYEEGNKTVEQHDEIFTNDPPDKKLINNQTSTKYRTVFDFNGNSTSKADESKDSHFEKDVSNNTNFGNPLTERVTDNTTARNVNNSSLLAHGELGVGTSVYNSNDISEEVSGKSFNATNSTDNATNKTANVLSDNKNSSNTSTLSFLNGTTAQPSIGNNTQNSSLLDIHQMPFNKSQEHSVTGPTKSIIKDVKLLSNEEPGTENIEQHQVTTENTDSDNIPFDESETADNGEAGDNVDNGGNDNTETSLANILGQQNDGIEYENIDKATTFKDLGSSEMKGIANAMSTLNAQDVRHLRTNMKTIDSMDHNAPNQFGHLKKVGIHETGMHASESSDSNLLENNGPVQPEGHTMTERGRTISEGQPGTTGQNDVMEQTDMTGEELVHENNGEHFVHNPTASLLPNDINMQEQGISLNDATGLAAHEAQANQDSLQEASSVPATISSAAIDTSTNAQESMENAKQLATTTGQVQELTNTGQESPLLQNDVVSNMQTDNNPIEGVTNDDNGAENGMVAQRSQSSNSLAGSMALEDNASYMKQKINEIEQSQAEGDLNNIDEQSALTTLPDLAKNSEERSKLQNSKVLKTHHHLLKNHTKFPLHLISRSHRQHPKDNVVVKGIAKNTILKVPIAISYTKVPEDDSNEQHHKVEHIMNDVIHDVKNELHGGLHSELGVVHHAHIHGHSTHAVNEILPHLNDIDDGPVVGSPSAEHSVTLYEKSHYIPAKSTHGHVDEFSELRPEVQHEVNVVRHTHHVVTVNDDDEKQRMVNGLVDFTTDRCVSLQLINELGSNSRYRLISSINKHGYTPRGTVFTLKTVFKDPSSHKYVSFHAIDEREPNRQVTLDGAKELISVPTPCSTKPKIVHVASFQPSKYTVTGTRYHDANVLNTRDMIERMNSMNKRDMERKRNGVFEDEIYKKNHIAFPQHYIIHNVNQKNKRQKITHIYIKKDRVEDAQKYPGRFTNPNNPAIMKSTIHKTPCTRTHGGTMHSDVQCCHFPFIYNGQEHFSCISNGGQSWCGLTGNVDKDRRWGLCALQDIPAEEGSAYRQRYYGYPKYYI